MAYLRPASSTRGEPDGLPTSVRFIYYELVQKGIVTKEKTGARRPDQDVQEAITALRQCGLIPWHWIVDETRRLTTWRYGANVSYHVAVNPSARIDLWGGEAPPMILTESRSLQGALHNLTAEYLVPIASTNGQVGGFLRTDIAPALSVGRRIIYLGDFDWQGGQIEANTRAVLEQEIGGGLSWQRLAITEMQVAEHDLPRILKLDKRYNPDNPLRYHDAVETEALGQSVIVGIVRDELDMMLPEPLSDVLEREAAQRAAVRKSLARIAAQTKRQ